MVLVIGSYTLLKTFEQCPRQAHHRFVLRDLPFEETEAIKWGSRVHKALENRIRRGTPLPDDMPKYEKWVTSLPHAEAEMKVAVRQDWSFCDFFADDVWFRGKADVVAVNGSSAIIVDWKTGKRREDPDELEILAALLKARHPELLNIVGWYVWLKDHALGKLHHLSAVADKRKEIDARMAQVARAEQHEHWPPNETPLCGWCGVKTCEFHPKGTR